jgi:hypothetical protein
VSATTNLGAHQPSAGVRRRWSRESYEEEDEDDDEAAGGAAVIPSLSESLSCLPGLNLADRLAAISIDAPVLGLRPVRA